LFALDETPVPSASCGVVASRPDHSSRTTCAAVDADPEIEMVDPDVSVPSASRQNVESNPRSRLFWTTFDGPAVQPPGVPVVGLLLVRLAMTVIVRRFPAVAVCP
jgi:hypothetical protein